MWLKTVSVAVALVSGAALAIQVGCNNGLRARLGSPILAALASFGIGTAALLAYVAVQRPDVPAAGSLRQGPWWIWVGGLLGAVYVASAATFATRLGAAAWLALIVAAQVLASLVLDHY